MRPAGVYNVCSGVTPSIREIVARLGEVAGVGVEHVVDPDLVRGHEVMEVRGAHDRLTRATGWEPVIPLRPHPRRRRRLVGAGAGRGALIGPLVHRERKYRAQRTTRRAIVVSDW